MALWNNPPHRVSSYTVDSKRDGGGGTDLDYTVAQSSIACSVNTATSDTIDLFARDQIKVTHTVAFLASVLTTALTPGMKLVKADTSTGLHVKGISKGQAYGNIPAFVYAFCEEI